MKISLSLADYVGIVVPLWFIAYAILMVGHAIKDNHSPEDCEVWQESNTEGVGHSLETL